jgi:serine/threonine protein kinase
MPRDPLGIVGKLVRVTTGEYAVRRLVAEGGFGLVYEAEWLDRRRRVALKVLKVEEAIAGGYDAEARARFEQEARLLVELRHPAIIELLAFDHLASTGGPHGDHAPPPSERTSPFLVLEWIEGVTLDARVNESGALTPAEALALLSPVADAIGLAHSRGVIHRDLKPANLLLGRAIDSRDRPDVPIRVLDFGVARWASPNGVRTTTTSKTGLSIGYAAPEQYGKEFGPVDGRADQFALAAILYFALTGIAPFAGTSLTEVLFATCASVERPSLTKHRLDLAGPLDEVLRKALSIRPDDRYASVEQFFRALEEAARILPPLTLETPTAKAPPAFSETSKPAPTPPVATLPSPALPQIPARVSPPIDSLTSAPTRPPSPAALAFAATSRADHGNAGNPGYRGDHGDRADAGPGTALSGARVAPTTRVTGAPPPTRASVGPSSDAPSSAAASGRGRTVGRVLLFLAIGAAAAATVYAALPWFQESGAAKPVPSGSKGGASDAGATKGSAPSGSTSGSASASASASSSITPLPGCGEVGKDESCIVGGRLHRGPDDCASRGGEADHRAVCPAQEVDVATFVLDRKEVTVGRYASCVAAGKCTAYPGGDGAADLPVRAVRYADAIAFCRWDHGKRLPSDDEWELAAAGIEGRAFPWGNARATATLAIFAGEGEGRQGPMPVGSAPAGATADYVLDLAGNVAEWTSTSAGASAPSPPDPEPEVIDDAAMPPSKIRRWVRGGSYRSTWDLLRSWSREAYPETLRSPAIGFRCARGLPRPKQ